MNFVQLLSLNIHEKHEIRKVSLSSSGNNLPNKLIPQYVQ